jgi:hypothetical protein
VALSVPQVPQVEQPPPADDQVEGTAADKTLLDAFECLAISPNQDQRQGPVKVQADPRVKGVSPKFGPKKLIPNIVSEAEPPSQ